MSLRNRFARDQKDMMCRHANAQCAGTRSHMTGTLNCACHSRGGTFSTKRVAAQRKLSESHVMLRHVILSASHVICQHDMSQKRQFTRAKMSARETVKRRGETEK
jgi:hypothetical protein